MAEPAAAGKLKSLCDNWNQRTSAAEAALVLGGLRHG